MQHRVRAKFSGVRWVDSGALVSMQLACGGRAAEGEASHGGAGGSSPDSTMSVVAGAIGGSAGALGVCPDGVPSADEIAQTPRADQNLELLALKLTSGIVAEQADYDRVVRDMAAIRAQNPALADIDFYSMSDGQSVLLSVSVDTIRAMPRRAHARTSDELRVARRLSLTPRKFRRSRIRVFA